MKIEDGKRVELEFDPDPGYRFSKYKSRWGQNPWNMHSDKLVKAVFLQEGNPYDIPDKYWNNVIKPDARAFLKDPQGKDQPNNAVVIEFSGLFDNLWLKGETGKQAHDPEQYAEDIAEIVKLDARLHDDPDCGLNKVTWSAWHWVYEGKQVAGCKERLRSFTCD